MLHKTKGFDTEKFNQEELKDRIIDLYEDYFRKLKKNLLDIGIKFDSILPVDLTIIKMERGVYSDTISPMYFDYFSATHTIFCQKNDLSGYEMNRLYKVRFVNGEDFTFALSKPLGVKKLEYNNAVNYLEDTWSQLFPHQKKELDNILAQIIHYEHAYFSQELKKQDIKNTITGDIGDVLSC